MNSKDNFTCYCRENKINDMAAALYRKEIMASLGYQRFALACAVDQVNKACLDAVKRSVAVFVRRK